VIGAQRSWQPGCGMYVAVRVDLQKPPSMIPKPSKKYYPEKCSYSPLGISLLSIMRWASMLITVFGRDVNPLDAGQYPGAGIIVSPVLPKANR